jgi:hypothetical protein
MTKVEQRHRNFASGMEKLGNNSRKYIHKLTHALFLVEKMSGRSVLVKKSTELETNSAFDTEE